MKNYKLFASLTALFTLMLVSLGVQASGNLSVTTDVFTGICTVTASLDNVKNEPVSVEVIPAGIDKSELKVSGDALIEALQKIEYFNQIDCDSSGVALFSFIFKNSGEYIVRVHSMTNRGNAIEKQIDVVDIDDATAVWEGIISEPEDNLSKLIEILGINDEIILSNLSDDELMSAIKDYTDLGSFTQENADAFILKIKTECETIGRLRKVLSQIENVGNITQIKSIISVPENADLLGITDYMERYNSLKNTKIADKAVAGKAFTKAQFVKAFAAGIKDAEEAEDENEKISQTLKSPSGGGGGYLGSSAIEPPKQEAQTPEIQNVHPFTDISNVNWAVEAIASLYNKGIINGKSSNVFAPYDNVTREEFVKIAICMMEVEPSANASAFEDVNLSSWYAPYVNAAVSAGIISGYSETRFGVGEYITRQDVTVILDRIYRPSRAAGSVSFADSDDIADYAAEAVDRLSGAGVINGDDGKFMPKSYCTRAEAACMVYRMMSIMKEGK